MTIKKGTDTAYDLQLNAESVFPAFDPAGSTPETAQVTGSVSAAGAVVGTGWVGFGDEVDYVAFTLDHAANLILDCEATDSTKFTLYNSAMTSVTNVSVKGGGYAVTKAKLLDAGQYYLQVQSTNAKNGGYSEFTVTVDAGTKFFEHPVDDNNTWATAEPCGPAAAGSQIGRAHV